ncbi:MAG: zinc ribbon domain-containing protein [Thermodesulfobacteriota bacterium]|nr:zinc ribbon domain-containing protein [Thermodesulfobacteriota bacterium]
MPIYEYRCRKCNHVFEELQKMGEGNETVSCPVCKELHPDKLMSCCNSMGSADVSSFDSVGSSPSCGSGGFS